VLQTVTDKNDPGTMKLVKYEAARKALAEAQKIDEVKKIRDKAAALQAYAKQAQDKELEWYASEIRLRAKYRLGQISKTLETEKPGPKVTSQRREVTPKNKALKEAGLSTSEAHRCEQLASVPEKKLEAHIAENKNRGEPLSSTQIISTITRKVRREKKKKEVRNKKLPKEQYSFILADPPWRYEHMISESREIENQYPTMELQKICDLRVGKLAADDCMLYLWTTASHTKQALEVIDAWGFDYRTNMVWVKPSIGPGYYVRQRHELILIARKGEPMLPDDKDKPNSVIEAPRQKHSQKPEIVYEIIEKAYPDAKRIELFSRNKREGWSAWGNEQV